MRIVSKIFAGSGSVKRGIALALALYLGGPVGLSAQFLEEKNTGKDDKAAIEEELTKAGIVRSIKAELINAGENTIRLSWIPSGQPGDCVIARATVPISNLEILKEATLVDTRPSSEHFILDPNLKPGTYYYAVVHMNKLKQNKLLFVPKENYTVSAVQVSQVQKATVAQTPPRVTLLFASLIKKNTAEITWKPVKKNNIIYTVYRGNIPLKNKAAIDQSLKLAEIRNGANYFIDKDLVKPGKYFYAVTTRLPGSGADYNLTAEQSYTRDPIVISPDTKTAITGFIDAAAQGPGQILVKWQDVKISGEQAGAQTKIAPPAVYKLYRGHKPLTSSEEAGQAVLVGQVKPGVGQYLDTGLPDGVYYYAVVAVPEKGNPSETFIAGKNFTNKPVTLGDPGEAGKSAKLLKFVAERHSENRVYLRWKLYTGGQGDLNLRLYRSAGQIESAEDLEEAQLIGTVSAYEEKYNEENVPAGVWYYGAQLLNGQTPLVTGFQPGVNYTTSPVVVEEATPVAGEIPEMPEPESPPVAPVKNRRPQVISAIKGPYKNGDYKRALGLLMPVARDTRQSGQTRALAILYAGISYYRLGNYNRSLGAFRHQLVRQYYPDRARHWYRETLARLR